MPPVPPVGHVRANNGSRFGRRLVDRPFPLELPFLNQRFERGADQFLLLGIQLLIVVGLQMLANLDQAGSSVLLVHVTDCCPDQGALRYQHGDQRGQR